MAGSSATVNSQGNKLGKRHWTPQEDAALIACMVDLRSLGTHNADTGFKSGYLPELEKMLTKKLPDCGLKARPHIESRLKTMKKEWSIVYDMMYGPNTSGFGWDESRKMVTAENAVWDAYIVSHKDDAPFKTRSFPFFEKLSLVYAKDRATGKDAQAVEDILHEMNLDEQQTETEEANPIESTDGNTPASADVSLTGPTSTPTREVGSASSGKKRKMNDTNFMPLSDAVNNIAIQVREACNRLSDSLETDILQKKLLELPAALRAIDGLNTAERRFATPKFAKYPNDVLLFFGTAEDERLDLVQHFLRFD